ncbi:gamma-glutamyltranspeptidase, partial [Pisolithus thermaeus]
MPVVTFDWEKINQPDLVFQRFPSRRPQVYSTKGIVACSQPLAAEAGLEILRRGGNAADAAVATAAALNVTEPSSCGIGGDAFCLFYDAKTEAVKGLNGSGRAAAAWVDTIHSFGSHKLSVAEVLAPAIRLAEDGVPVSEIHSFSWQRSEKLIKDASPNGGEMLLDGRAPLPGQIMKFPNLAHTFRVLAEQGRDGFYKGEVAKAIVELIQSQGGVMEMEDFATHESTFVEPIKYTYGNEVTVCECPPNGQGITALLALGILEQIQEQGKVKPLLEMEHNSPEYLHTLIEDTTANSRYYVTDPEFHHIPVNKLLSKDYLAERAHLFNPARANPKVIHGNPVNSSDTVYFTGTTLCLRIFCLDTFRDRRYDRYGSPQTASLVYTRLAVPKNCGFTLQNRGAGFVLQEGHPNCLQGGKRPYHTIIPAMALKGDELFLTYGVMGGFMQPQGHVQVLLNILRGFTVQAALDAPRFCISPGTPEAGARDEFSVVNGEVYFEETFPPDTITKLQEMGHDARVASGFDRGKMGRGQVIQKLVDKSGKFVWAAGSDPRADGHAVPSNI